MTLSTSEIHVIQLALEQRADSLNNRAQTIPPGLVRDSILEAAQTSLRILDKLTNAQSIPDVQSA